MRWRGSTASRSRPTGCGSPTTSSMPPSVSDDVDAAIDDAITHLRAFNERQLERFGDWSFESEPGLVVGEKISPITSAGLFTPSGKASYPSVTYQLAVPAVVAGVPTLAVVVPPVPGGSGEVDPAVLVVCRKLGIRDVFRVNGPSGIAALGFGTERDPAGREGHGSRLAGGHDRAGRDAAPRRRHRHVARPDREPGDRRRLGRSCSSRCPICSSRPSTAPTARWCCSPPIRRSSRPSSGS